MHILQCQDVSVQVGGREIFRGLNWAIDERAKIGLVGANGAGKSTLLRMISGDITPSQGTITRMKGISIGYLPQEVRLVSGSLYEAASAPSPDLAGVLADLEAVEARLEQPEVYTDSDRLSAALEEQQALLLRYERLEPERQASRVRELLAALGFTADDYDLPTSVLSGGQVKLAALARLAAWSPDLLLLDEPDNHLDVRAKTKLEAFIRDLRGAVLLVSHDRYLLDFAVEQIAELEDGGLSLYRGNYSAYTVERDLRRIRQSQVYAAQQKQIARVEAMIKEWEQKAQADLNERHARQAASRRKMLARLEASGELVDDVIERRLMGFQIDGGRGSTKAIELKDLAIGFSDKVLFSGLNLLIRHGERVGLVGSNGAGKSVLFKLILGSHEPLAGAIRLGPSTRIGYYAQQHETLEPWRNRTPLDLVRDLQPMSEGAAVAKLLKFAFSYQQARQPIHSLSGGERSRLQLLALVLQNPNLLLLDEPTNNLDIASADIMESALEDFEGAIFAISHDRYFLDRIVNHIVELEAGALTEFAGGYSDYVRSKNRRMANGHVLGGVKKR